MDARWYQIGLEEFDESRMIISAEGENGESINVAATAISESRSYSFDTEGATEEPATVRGNEAVVYQVKTEDEDKVTVLWTDIEKGWIVRVTGYNISKEDMLRISENVEIRIKRKRNFSLPFYFLCCTCCMAASIVPGAAKIDKIWRSK